MNKLNAIQYNRILPLRRELYYSDDCRAEGLSYNMSINNVNNTEIRNALFDIMCLEEEGFYALLEDLINQFNYTHPEYTAGMCGRMSKHLCLFTNGKDKKRPCFYYTDNSTPAAIKRDFTKLARTIRNAYIDWARETMN